MVEHEADGICQQAMELLHTSFITPIDRGDIHRLAARLDDILDHIEATAQKLWLYEVASCARKHWKWPRISSMARAPTKAAVDALAKRPGSEHARDCVAR